MRAVPTVRKRHDLKNPPLMMAYGLSIPALSGAASTFDSATREWHEIELVREHRAAPTEGGSRVGCDEAVFRLRGQLWLTVRRTPLQALVASNDPTSEEVITHPLLAWVAAVAASWTSRCAFHGSAVVLGGRAWVLLGGPGAGKTSLAALLQGDGAVVLADDLSVVERGIVFAGPRAADLRQAAAMHLGLGKELDQHIGRRRWRIPLGRAPMEVPLGGFVELGWSDELRVDPVPPRERLGLLALHDALWLGPGEPRDFLELITRPCWRLRRPDGWNDVDATIRAVRELAQSAAR